MKNYNQREKFTAYLALGALGSAIFLLCFLAEYVGGRTLAKWMINSALIFFGALAMWRTFYHDRKIYKWIWWCSTCSKEVSAKEVNHEEIHKSCGREATYKLKK